MYMSVIYQFGLHLWRPETCCLHVPLYCGHIHVHVCAVKYRTEWIKYTMCMRIHVSNRKWLINLFIIRLQMYMWFVVVLADRAHV